MQQKSYGPLIRFCLAPLIFTLDTAYMGVIAGIGVLILYPFIAITIEQFKKHLHSTDAFYISSFVGALSGTLYILSIGMIDWRLYEQLAFVFPASIISSSMIIGWLEEDHTQMSSPFLEAFISAILILAFACLRDYLLHGVLDFRFGDFGIIYNFGGYTPFSNFEQIIVSEKYIWLSSIKLRGIIFFIIALFILLMGTPTKDKQS